jgi:hypothetical protein
MNLYNYDYSDMMNISFGYDENEKIRFTSKLYPTNIEVKVDKETNRPYLYYEGITQTNKGAMKVTFPRLDLVLDCASIQTNSESIGDPLRFKYCCQFRTYEMTTKFSNLNEDSVLYELRHFNEEDYKDIQEHFDEGGK